MDRNTLLAFFLISLILIFTPKYMEMVSPTPEPNTYESEGVVTNPENPSLDVEETVIQPIRPGKTTPSITNLDDTIIELETPLYIARVSSRSGGTITEFNIKNYLTTDSSLVNLILPNQSPNLQIQAKDLDGNELNLGSPWELVSSQPPSIIKEPFSLEFKKEVFKSRYIYKTLVFNPYGYTIGVDIDLSSIRGDIYRDVLFGWHGGLASTEKNRVDDRTYFKAYAYMGGELEELKGKLDKREEKKFSGETDWLSVRTKYFTSSLIPGSPTDVMKSALVSPGDSLETYDAYFVLDVNSIPAFTLFLGPLEYERIKNLGVNLDSIMDFGWAFIRPISKGVLYALKLMHNHIPNYGFVLIVFAFLVKLLVYPLTKKSYQSTSAMQAIQPEVNALREKHKSNPTKLNQATMELYKKRGVNPLGGCLPMLLQMPLLFALFIVFRTTIELRAEPFVWWVKDLSSPDIIVNLPFHIPIYGAHIAALPIFMVISMFIQQKMMMTGGAQQAQQKTMQYFMTAFFFLIFNSFPSGLNLYYTLFNVLTIAQQKLVPTNTASAK